MAAILFRAVIRSLLTWKFVTVVIRRYHNQSRNGTPTRITYEMAIFQQLPEALQAGPPSPFTYLSKRSLGLGKKLKRNRHRNL